MAESPLFFALLGLIGLCMALITVTVMLTAWDLRRTLRRLYDILPSFERAAREASSTFAHTRKLVAQAHAISALVEGMTERTSMVMSAVAHTWNQMTRQAQQWVEHSFGKRNGTRSGPRRHARGS